MRRLAAALAFGALAFGAGCGGGTPLLHPARTLSQGDVRMMAGMSAQFAGGDLASSIAGARERAAQQTVPGAPEQDPVYASGALVAAAVAPGMAPPSESRTRPLTVAPV